MPEAKNTRTASVHIGYDGKVHKSYREIVTTNCGTRVQHLSDKKIKSLFAQLERFGVRHEDPFLRNITYRNSDGQFCLIDFEFATLIDNPEVSLKPVLATDLEAHDG